MSLVIMYGDFARQIVCVNYDNAHDIFNMLSIIHVLVFYMVDTYLTRVVRIEIYQQYFPCRKYIMYVYLLLMLFDFTFIYELQLCTMVVYCSCDKSLTVM